MESCSDLVVTGIGVTSAVGQGQDAFLDALLEGRANFHVMQRPGRQCPVDGSGAAASAFLGAEIPGLSLPESLPKAMLRTASFSAQVAMVTLQEAWQDA